MPTDNNKRESVSLDCPDPKAALPSSSPLLLVEKIPAILWTTDTEFRVISVAGVGLGTADVRAEDYRGASLDEVLPGLGPQSMLLLAHQRALRGEASTIGLEMKGRGLQAHVEPLRQPNGEIIGVIGVALDNTERGVAERALWLSEQSYRTLIEGAPFGICRSTVSGQLLQVNHTMAEMLGYESEAELLLRSVRTDISAEPSSYDQFLAQLRSRTSCQGFECKWKRQNGKTMFISLAGRALRDDAGEISYLEILAENVTEKKHLEDQLRQAQKMQAIGQLAGGIAHDFNNLLTVIKGHGEMVHAEMKADDPLRHRVEEIQGAAERASALTKQLLAFSRMQMLQSQVVDLNAVIAGMSEMLGRLIGETIELNFVAGTDLGRIKADPSQLEQVLMNLVVNARDAMPEGGRLTIETRNAQVDEAYARQFALEKSGEYVALVVSDTGQGMDPEIQAHAFEPFFTTKNPGEGTGLGLSVVYSVVKQSGGFIELESERGNGTVFKVYLPRVPEPVEEKKAAPVSDVLKGSETVLLAEDEEGVRKLISTFLGSMGYRVLQAGDGATARQLAHSHEGEIDLLITDLIMPKSGGRQLAEELQKAFPRLKVIFISGYTDDLGAHHAVLESRTAFVQKPFSMKFLASKVREVLDGSCVPSNS